MRPGCQQASEHQGSHRVLIAICPHTTEHPEHSSLELVGCGHWVGWSNPAATLALTDSAHNFIGCVARGRLMCLCHGGPVSIKEGDDWNTCPAQCLELGYCGP